MVEGNNFTVTDGGGDVTATITKSGVLAINMNVEGTRYYMIKTTISGKYESTSWLNKVGTFLYEVNPSDTIEIYFEGTATKWSGNFEGKIKNALVWNSVLGKMQINTSADTSQQSVNEDISQMFKYVLNGDMQALAMALYPQDFIDNNKNK